MSRSVLVGLSAVLLFGAVLVLPGGQAQGPSPHFKLDVRPNGPLTITDDLGSATISFAVTVNSTQPNPLDNQFDLRVDISKITPSFPNGWAVHDPDPAFLLLKVGATGHFTVVVEVTQGSPEGDEVNPEYRFDMTPLFQGDQSNPVTAQLVNSLSQKDSTTKKVKVTRDLAGAEAVTSFVKQYMWFLLAAAGGIFVLGVALVRKKKGGVSVYTDSPVQEVLPGRGASFPLEVRGEGGARQAVSLATSEVPEGWSAILPVDRIELAGTESTTIWLTVKAPEGAQAGEHVQVSFIATPSDGSPAEALLEAVVVEKYGRAPVEVQVGAAPRKGGKGR